MRKKKGKSPKKDERLKRNLARTILQYIGGKRYSPLTAEELIAQLTIPENVHQTFFSALELLVQEKELVLNRDRYQLQKEENQLVVGTISVHPVKGFGFVSVTGKEKGKDVFIPKQHMGNAINGDTVEIEITEVTAKGPEGRIIAILKRSRSHLGCTILEKEKGRYLAYAPLLGAQKAVYIKSPEKLKLEEGDRLICKVIDWNTDDGAVSAEVVRRIGHISDPSCDVAAAIEEFELPDGFSKEAIQEAKAYGKRVSADNRLDLSHLETVTIDPDTAKDFDDAISLTQDEKGHFFLGVHIADAAWYVKKGSHLDREAFQRCNSTYFPGFCLPMLPEELSTELCSLKANVKRLTISLLAEFDSEATLVDYKIVRACIKSRKRFTYEEAFDVLEKRRKNTYLPLLDRMVALCKLFKEKRRGRGSIDFAMAEGKIFVDEMGTPLKIVQVEYDITHQMIEEFMLKANEIVSIHLAKQGKEQIFRIHEEPSTEAFEDFYAYARALGFPLPSKPTSSDLQQLFERAKDSPLAPQLSVSFIRSMKQALYSPENLGHFGLALEYYCHFTSPIRRYTDLVIQRLLFDEADVDADLASIALACSEKERLSMRAENSVVLLKKLRLAAAAFAKNPAQSYAVAITKTKPFAIFFEVPEFALEGSIHVSELGRDYFEYNPKTLTFRGSRSGRTFSCGSQISVQLASIDLIRQNASWQIVPAKK